MTAVLILIAFAVGFMLAHVVLNRKAKSTYLATAEYWVYLPEESLPNQDDVMSRMLAHNPYGQPGRSPIGPSEGLLFSDIRLHIALVRRSVNAHVFRPDLFADVEIDSEALEALAEAQAFAKIRYLSEEPLADKRHLQFLLHAADAVAELGNGTLIYDKVAERMYRREELSELLRRHLDVTIPELHLRVVWKPEPHGGRAETKGLRKIGRSDLRTETVESDEQLIVSSVLEEAANALWRHPELEDGIEVEAYDDRFQVLFEKTQIEPTPVRILRIQAT